MPPIRPHCEEAAERDSNPGQVNPEAGTLTTRSPHLLNSEINPIESRFNLAKKSCQSVQDFRFEAKFRWDFPKARIFRAGKKLFISDNCSVTYFFQINKK